MFLLAIQMIYKIITVAFAAAAYELILPGNRLRKSYDLLSAVRILSDRMIESGSLADITAALPQQPHKTKNNVLMFRQLL